MPLGIWLWHGAKSISCCLSQFYLERFIRWPLWFLVHPGDTKRQFDLKEKFIFQSWQLSWPAGGLLPLAVTPWTAERPSQSHLRSFSIYTLPKLLQQVVSSNTGWIIHTDVLVITKEIPLLISPCHSSPLPTHFRPSAFFLYVSKLHPSSGTWTWVSSAWNISLLHVMSWIVPILLQIPMLKS